MGKKLTHKRAAGIRRVYDLGTHTNHNFIANGTVVHNCTEKGALTIF